jgi:Ras-related protein Rab-6A
MSNLKIEIIPESSNEPIKNVYKVIVIGDTNVGKSSIAHHAIYGKFEEHEPTVGYENLFFKIKINDTPMKLDIWDTCGQELYHSLISTYFKDSKIAILVYSIDNKESFEHLEKWMDDIKKNADKDIRILLVGNKLDKIEDRVISSYEVEKFTDDHKIDNFFEASAKEGTNTKEIFIDAAKILYKYYIQGGSKNTSKKDNIKIENNKGIDTNEIKEKIRSNCCFFC